MFSTVLRGMKLSSLTCTMLYFEESVMVILIMNMTKQPYILVMLMFLMPEISISCSLQHYAYSYLLKRYSTTQISDFNRFILNISK